MQQIYKGSLANDTKNMKPLDNEINCALGESTNN